MILRACLRAHNGISFWLRARPLGLPINNQQNISGSLIDGTGIPHGLPRL